jgi:biotin carboxyl carrier protein
MKYKVKVNGKVYEVEIVDLDDRPIKALIDEVVFEVWPMSEKDEDRIEIRNRSKISQAKILKGNNSIGNLGSRNNQNHSQHAPLPGIILSVSVKEGDVIEMGQELCVIEAMKMKNLIKATNSGKISKVLVVPGQHVQHRDTLFKFD